MSSLRRGKSKNWTEKFEVSFCEKRYSKERVNKGAGGERGPGVTWDSGERSRSTRVKRGDDGVINKSLSGNPSGVVKRVEKGSGQRDRFSKGFQRPKTPAGP